MILAAAGLFPGVLLAAPAAPELSPGASAAAPATGEPLRVGNLVDFTGRTAMIGSAYGRGQVDAVAYINAEGGVAGRPIAFMTVDYAYILPAAVTAYTNWKMQGPLAAVEGWGASDAEALRDFSTRDKVPYFSADFSPGMADPVGTTGRPGAPYHFIVGPTYADALRALLQWAHQDWRDGGKAGLPRYAHVGDGSDFSGSVRAAGETYARELGFTVLPPIGYGQAGEAQETCKALKEAAVDYAYLAGTRDVNAPLVKECRKMGVTARFMTNIWGFDERFMDLDGPDADGIVWVMANAPWGTNAPGQKTLEAISAMAPPPPAAETKDDKEAAPPAGRSLHYIQGVCSVFFLRDAMTRASAMEGGITGPNIKAALEDGVEREPKGLEGICNPASWRPQDHRSVSNVWVYMSHVTAESRSIERVYRALVPLRPDWLGQ
jgi:branched-chain amino acid transport system substrate-binding protein